MKRPAPLATRPSVALRFKAEIELAEADGVAADELALHLTPGDAEQLKRDRNVPVADISFAGGRMTYLGVAVVKGETPPSALRRRDADGA